MKITEKCKIIFNMLEASNKEAYLVGGCVRDALLGKEPHDYDFTTNATPEEIAEIFKDYPLGLVGAVYGTIVVNIDGENFEVTTYRKDGEYSDGRRPDDVVFTSDIEDDLSRRDFTVNAIAYNPNTGYVDPFNGQEDIKKGVIRAVGNPQERFVEDPVRMLRAIRFATQLDFNIDKETSHAMFECKNLLSVVARERYTKEFKKIMASDIVPDYLYKYWDVLFSDYPEFIAYDGFDQKNPAHIYDLKGHTIEAIRYYSGNNVNAKIALLFHDIGKLTTQVETDNGVCRYYGHPDVSEEITKRILQDMRFENAEIKEICTLVKYHDNKIPLEIKPMKRWILKLGETGIRDLFDVSEADCLAHNPAMTSKRLNYLADARKSMEEALQDMSAFSKKDLKINGRDIIDLGYSEGKIVGDVLEDIFQKVLDKELANEKEKLIEYVKNLRLEENLEIG